MHMSKTTAVINMHIQFIADLAVLFGVQFGIKKENTPKAQIGLFVCVCLLAGVG